VAVQCDRAQPIGSTANTIGRKQPERLGDALSVGKEAPSPGITNAGAAGAVLPDDLAYHGGYDGQDPEQDRCHGREHTPAPSSLSLPGTIVWRFRHLGGSARLSDSSRQRRCDSRSNSSSNHRHLANQSSTFRRSTLLIVSPSRAPLSGRNDEAQQQAGSKVRLPPLRKLLAEADDEPKRLALIDLLIQEGARDKLAQEVTRENAFNSQAERFLRLEARSAPPT
jgi:hypothetical protein